jgi:hypothetical protein
MATAPQVAVHSSAGARLAAQLEHKRTPSRDRQSACVVDGAVTMFVTTSTSSFDCTLEDQDESSSGTKRTSVVPQTG